MPDADSHLHVVILAGGVGSRFWPASTPTQPKPLLSLGGTERPLIAETMDRALGLAPSHRVAILAGDHLASALHDVLPELDPTSVWIEPHARGTGPALAWAAHRISQEDPQAVMVSLHADHLIQPDGAFLELVTRAAKIAAMSDILLTIAVRPNRPETGYGYLNLGDPIGPEGDVHAWKVSSFMEKPDEAAVH